MSITDRLDVLRAALETELVLRAAAAKEWAEGHTSEGPTSGIMQKAHLASIAAATDAARILIQGT